jgi:hypothetical protein
MAISASSFRLHLHLAGTQLYFRQGANLAEWARTHGPVFNIRIMFENRVRKSMPISFGSV